MHMGGVYTASNQEGSILWQKSRYRNGRGIEVLFKSSVVRGRCDCPEFRAKVTGMYCLYNIFFGGPRTAVGQQDRNPCPQKGAK